MWLDNWLDVRSGYLLDGLRPGAMHAEQGS
jgi:hypothetical protein